MRDNNSDKRLWYALYTKPRFEKKVDRDLRSKGIESFLPLFTTVSIWSDRKKQIETPLFASYVLVYANAVERLGAVQTAGVIRMLMFDGAPATIPAHQIRAIKEILTNNMTYEVVPYFKNGETTEIVSGPLEGLRGSVLECRGQNRFIIAIGAIRQSLSVEIDGIRLRKIRQVATYSP